ncbi:MAG: SWIM zinc finger domain-containing protein [Kiritimatiellia bacterium]
MNPKLEECLRKLNRDDIRKWVGDPTAQRGELYQDRVGEIVALENCLAAKVRGTDEYTTNLFVNADGKPTSICTCPVGANCKHGVALALCASKKLQDGGVTAIRDGSDSGKMLVTDKNMSPVARKNRRHEEKKHTQAHRG